jgi:hypothetical protein
MCICSVVYITREILQEIIIIIIIFIFAVVPELNKYVFKLIKSNIMNSSSNSMLLKNLFEPKSVEVRT